MSEVAVIPDADVGAYGGYRVELDGRRIGYVERCYRTWERSTKGRRYVNARGKCKRVEFRALNGEWHRGSHRTLRDAVAYLVEQCVRKEGVR